jgi:MATE family multidrug resistance protein
MTPPSGTSAAAVGALPGGSLREVLRLAYPVVLAQMSTTAMGVVDSAMVGRLGATPLAAVGFGSIWLWTFLTIFYGTANGVQTFVSQADGAGTPQRCGAWAWQACYAVVPAAAVAMLLIAVGMGPLLALLGPSEELQSTTMAYILPRLPGEVAMAAGMALSSFFRGVGDTRTPLYTTLVANVVNAVLDYGLIFGRLGLPEWGVAGAGAATSAGSWIATVLLYVAFRRRSVSRRYETRPVRADRVAIRRFLRVGLPIGGQWCIEMSAFALFTTLVARMGDASMAASQAFVMLLSMSFMQAHGIEIAASTLVGRYVGAGNPEAAVRSLRSSLQLGAILASAIAVAFLAIPELLMRIFTDDPAIVALGKPLLALGALFQLFDAAAIITEGALRGAGDTRWPFAVHVILGWGFLLPAAWAFGVLLDGGLTGAWLAGLLQISALAAILTWRFRSGAWRHIRI